MDFYIYTKGGHGPQMFTWLHAYSHITAVIYHRCLPDYMPTLILQQWSIIDICLTICYSHITPTTYHRCLPDCLSTFVSHQISLLLTNQFILCGRYGTRFNLPPCHRVHPSLYFVHNQSASSVTFHTTFINMVYIIKQMTWTNHVLFISDMRHFPNCEAGQ